jgi:hypothetical protein
MARAAKAKTVDGVTYVSMHAGQKRAYGDSFYEYEIVSALPAAEVESVCREKVHKAMPAKAYTDEYRAKPTADNHFRPHYTFKSLGGDRYFYSVCFPYAD